MAAKLQQLMAGAVPKPDPSVPLTPPAAAAPATPPAPPKPAEPPKPSSEPPAEPPKPKNAEEKKAYDFAAQKKSLEEWQSKATTFEKDLAAARAEMERLKAKPASDPEKEALKKQLTEYDDIIRRVKVESHPKFVAFFGEKTAAALNLAKLAVGPSQAAAVEAVLKNPDAAARNARIEEMMGDLGPLAQSRLSSAIVELDKVQQEREYELARSREAFDQMTKQEADSQQAATTDQQQRRNQLADVILQQAVQFDSFKVREGDDAHNQVVKTNQQFVQDFIHGRLPQNMVPMVPVLASEAMYLREKVLPGLLQENNQLKEQIKGMVAATPAPGGGGGAEGGVPEVIDKSNPQAALQSFISNFERLGKGG